MGRTRVFIPPARETRNWRLYYTNNDVAAMGPTAAAVCGQRAPTARLNCQGLTGFHFDDCVSFYSVFAPTGQGPETLSAGCNNCDPHRRQRCRTSGKAAALPTLLHTPVLPGWIPKPEEDPLWVPPTCIVGLAG